MTNSLCKWTDNIYEEYCTLIYYSAWFNNIFFLIPKVTLLQTVFRTLMMFHKNIYSFKTYSACNVFFLNTFCSNYIISGDDRSKSLNAFHIKIWENNKFDTLQDLIWWMHCATWIDCSNTRNYDLNNSYYGRNIK